MLTLRQLRYLDALARQRHFGRAADECAVSQPALSMQIHELEDFLGGELVERRQGDALLTERGTKIAERAASILSATRDLIDFARHSGKLLVGTLRLGVIPTLAPYVLPRVIPALQRDHPELRLDLLEAHTKTLLDELARGNLDLLLLSLPVEKSDSETMLLFEDPFLLAVSSDDPLPERARATIADVRERNLLLLEDGHCLRDQALDYCEEVRSKSTAGFFATSLPTIMQMVACGYGITLLPEVAVDVELRDDRVKLLRFSDPQPKRRIGLMWRRSSPSRADFFAFGELVVDAMTHPQIPFAPAPDAVPSTANQMFIQDQAPANTGPASARRMRNGTPHPGSEAIRRHHLKDRATASAQSGRKKRRPSPSSSPNTFTDQSHKKF